MKNLLIFNLVFSLSNGLSSLLYAQDIDSRILPNTRIIEMKSNNSGKEYSIYLALPDSYDQNKEASYPVLYCLDANAGFGLMTQTYRYLRFGNEVPKMVIVGIGYPTTLGSEILAHRNQDMTPTPDPGNTSGTGGAPEFLQFIQTQLIPYIESEYRVIDDRTFVGHSHGGLFAVYTLFSAPGAFQRFIIGSPSLWYDNKVSFQIEEEYASSHTNLEATVFFSVGTEEESEANLVTLLKEMAEKLKQREYPGLKLTLTLFPDQTHLSSVPPTYSYGLRNLFKGSQGQD